MIGSLKYNVYPCESYDFVVNFTLRLINDESVRILLETNQTVKNNYKTTALID